MSFKTYLYLESFMIPILKKKNINLRKIVLLTNPAMVKHLNTLGLCGLAFRFFLNMFLKTLACVIHVDLCLGTELFSSLQYYNGREMTKSQL